MAEHCPICDDELGDDGWCSRCHGLTAEEPPEGFAWARFEGPHGGFGRMMQEGYIKLGSEYVTVVDGYRYVFNGERFEAVMTDA